MNASSTGDAKTRHGMGGRGVLSDLRQGWLADNDAGSTKQSGKRGGAVGDGTLGIIWEEFVRLLTVVKRSPSALVAAVKRSCEGMGERTAEAATGTPGMVALLGLVVVMGALLYAMTVQHIFDRGALSDAPSTTVSVSAKTSEETAAVASGPSGLQTSDALYESALRGFARAFGQANVGAVPHPETIAVAADWYGRSSEHVPVPRSYDYGNVFDWVDFRTAKAGSEPVQDTARLSRLAVERTHAVPQAVVYRAEPRAEQTRPSAELRRVSRPTVVPVDSILPDLERAQSVAANGGEGDVEATALAAIAHGGEAVFEVQHFDAVTGVWHPARIVVSAANLGFLPEGECEAGAFTISLASVSAVQSGQSDPARFDADLLNIEIGDRGKSTGGRLSLRAPLSSGAEADGSSESEMLTHIRNVIVATQRRS